MNKKIIDDNESVHLIVDIIVSTSKKRKMWTPPTISLLSLFDIQTGDGSGNEASNQGFWQSGLGS